MLRNFKPGDKVFHRQCPSWHGEVVSVGEVEDGPRGPDRRVYWKGTHSTDPEYVDWTWGWVLEHIAG